MCYINHTIIYININILGIFNKLHERKLFSTRGIASGLDIPQTKKIKKIKQRKNKDERDNDTHRANHERRRKTKRG